jgi:hypothetical protein
LVTVSQNKQMQADYLPVVEDTKVDYKAVAAVAAVLLLEVRRMERRCLMEF